jgi:hypothetical protein
MAQYAARHWSGAIENQLQDRIRIATDAGSPIRPSSAVRSLSANATQRGSESARVALVAPPSSDRPTPARRRALLELRTQPALGPVICSGEMLLKEFLRPLGLLHLQADYDLQTALNEAKAAKRRMTRLAWALTECAPIDDTGSG